jgi:hypothetical protein
VVINLINNYMMYVTQWAKLAGCKLLADSRMQTLSLSDKGRTGGWVEQDLYGLLAIHDFGNNWKYSLCKNLQEKQWQLGNHS